METPHTQHAILKCTMPIRCERCDKVESAESPSMEIADGSLECVRAVMDALIDEKILLLPSGWRAYQNSAGMIYRCPNCLPTKRRQ